jgi:16S rRNA (guanine527-N7)-methyltransferase
MPPNSLFSLTDERISSLLAPFGVRPSSDQILKVREYVILLLNWNESLSLTSIADPEEIIVRHFGESMFLSSVVPVEKGRLADLGSGAGFPGLALKIISPNLHVVLIESNKKKCAFLAEVVRTLDFYNVEVIPRRFEEIRTNHDFADFIAARALGDFPRLLKWSRTALKSEGHIALWVGGTDTTKIEMTSGWIWQPAIRIPESQRRFLLTGHPTRDR